jgi:hypothetical protein
MKVAEHDFLLPCIMCVINNTQTNYFLYFAVMCFDCYSQPLSGTQVKAKFSRYRPKQALGDPVA